MLAKMLVAFSLTRATHSVWVKRRFLPGSSLGSNSETFFAARVRAISSD
ncbi:hypothetical protein SB783_18235 [Paraburkholderia sp. SIMBA_009]